MLFRAIGLVQNQDSWQAHSRSEHGASALLGWRVDPGLRYRNVVKLMDYEAFRKDGSISVHDVPEPELFVEDGPPSFPIAAAADRALHGGKTEGSDPPPMPLREAPFGAPLTPSAVKSNPCT